MKTCCQRMVAICRVFAVALVFVIGVIASGTQVQAGCGSHDETPRMGATMPNAGLIKMETVYVPSFAKKSKAHDMPCNTPQCRARRGDSSPMIPDKLLFNTQPKFLALVQVSQWTFADDCLVDSILAPQEKLAEGYPSSILRPPVAI